MTSVRVPGFRPSTRGLHFPNAFPHVPNFEIDLPGGPAIRGDLDRGTLSPPGLVKVKSRDPPRPRRQPPGAGLGL